MASITQERLKKLQTKYKNYNYEAMLWCFDRGYKIYPVPSDKCYGVCKKFNLVVEFGGKKNKGSKIYSDKEWSDAIWGVYEFLYNKNAKNNKSTRPI